MVRIVARDSKKNEVAVNDKIKVSACCVRDGIPSWFQGRIAKIENITTEGCVQVEFLDEPLKVRNIAVQALQRYCIKYSGIEEEQLAAS